MKKVLVLIIISLLVAFGFYFYKTKKNTVAITKESEIVENSEGLRNDYEEPIAISAVQKLIKSQPNSKKQNVPVPDNLKKWVGKYYLEAEQEEGDDGKYLAIANIWVNPEGDGNFYYYVADIKSKKMIYDDDVQIYCEYDIAPDSLVMNAAVTSGDTGGINPELTIIERNGSFFAKTNVFYATTPDGLIPLKKVKE